MFTKSVWFNIIEEYLVNKIQLYLTHDFYLCIPRDKLLGFGKTCFGLFQSINHINPLILLFALHTHSHLFPSCTFNPTKYLVWIILLKYSSYVLLPNLYWFLTCLNMTLILPKQLLVKYFTSFFPKTRVKESGFWQTIISENFPTTHFLLYPPPPFSLTSL